MTAPKRIQLRRVKGWRKPAGVIVVARPTRWGNPYAIDDYEQYYPLASGHTRDQWRRMAVSDFRGLAEGRWDRSLPETPDYPSLAEIRAHLAGHDLACWCRLDHVCHADVLLELANEVLAA